MTVATTKGATDLTSSGKIPVHKPTATVHYLVEEKNNKYSKNKHLQKSIEYNGMIPFLRDHEEKYTMGTRAMRMYKKQRVKSMAQKALSKEYNWNRVGYPISMHNEKNHFSKKLKFEDL